MKDLNNCQHMIVRSSQFLQFSMKAIHCIVWFSIYFRRIFADRGDLDSFLLDDIVREACAVHSRELYYHTCVRSIAHYTMGSIFLTCRRWNAAVLRVQPDPVVIFMFQLYRGKSVAFVTKCPAFKLPVCLTMFPIEWGDYVIFDTKLINPGQSFRYRTLHYNKTRPFLHPSEGPLTPEVYRQFLAPLLPEILSSTYYNEPDYGAQVKAHRCRERYHKYPASSGLYHILFTHEVLIALMFAELLDVIEVLINRKRIDVAVYVPYLLPLSVWLGRRSLFELLSEEPLEDCLVEELLCLFLEVGDFTTFDEWLVRYPTISHTEVLLLACAKFGTKELFLKLSGIESASAGELTIDDAAVAHFIDRFVDDPNDSILRHFESHLQAAESLVLRNVLYKKQWLSYLISKPFEPSYLYYSTEEQVRYWYESGYQFVRCGYDTFFSQNQGAMEFYYSLLHSGLRIPGALGALEYAWEHLDSNGEFHCPDWPFVLTKQNLVESLKYQYNISLADAKIGDKYDFSLWCDITANILATGNEEAIRLVLEERSNPKEFLHKIGRNFLKMGRGYQGTYRNAIEAFFQEDIINVYDLLDLLEQHTNDYYASYYMMKYLKSKRLNESQAKLVVSRIGALYCRHSPFVRTSFHELFRLLEVVKYLTIHIAIDWLDDEYIAHVLKESAISLALILLQADSMYFDSHPDTLTQVIANSDVESVLVFLYLHGDKLNPSNNPGLLSLIHSSRKLNVWIEKLSYNSLKWRQYFANSIPSAPQETSRTP